MKVSCVPPLPLLAGLSLGLAKTFQFVGHFSMTAADSSFCTVVIRFEKSVWHQGYSFLSVAQRWGSKTLLFMFGGDTDLQEERGVLVEFHIRLSISDLKLGV